MNQGDLKLSSVELPSTIEPIPPGSSARLMDWFRCGQQILETTADPWAILSFGI
jgi:hypothetical protein